MILAQPFSRPNRSLMSWRTSGGEQERATSTMPRRPPSEGPLHRGPADADHPLRRSSTLSRADLERARRSQHSGQQASSSHHRPPPQPRTPNSVYSINPGESLLGQPPPQTHRWPEARPGQSCHYAATSFRAAPVAAPSESGASHKSGRESVLSNLRDRFETLKRRAAGWSRNSTRSTSGSPMVQPKPEAHATSNGLQHQLDASEIYAEGSVALDRNAARRAWGAHSDLEEGELRHYIGESSMVQPQFRVLVSSLTNWINDELSSQRIIVRDLLEDLHDGQVLGKLFEVLHGAQIDLVEVTQNESTQRHKLTVVLSAINRVLTLQARWAPIRWSVEGIHGKNMVEILHLVITLARYYRAPISLPPGVSVELQTVSKFNGRLLRRSQQVQLTGAQPDAQPAFISSRRDSFDALFEAEPEKLQFVQQSLVRFCNRHLNKVDLSCSSGNSQVEGTQALDPRSFSDGLLLVFIMSSVENYFVPLGNLFSGSMKPATLAHSSTHYSEPNSSSAYGHQEGTTIATAIQFTSYTNTQPIQMLHNVNVAFQLMEEAGVDARRLARPEDIVNGDLKSLLRVLFALFSRYKHL